MASRQRIVRRRPVLEIMEQRLVPSASGGHVVAASRMHVPHISEPSVFVAKLSPLNVVLPLDAKGDQIQGGGGAAMYPLPGPNDPATGTVKFAVADEGKAINVSITLSHISNVSAITIHDLNDPAVYALRGSTAVQGGQAPAIGSFSSTTLNSTQAPSANGQIVSSNIGQSVVVLLKPGPSSGPLRHATVNGVINAFDLTGPLAGRSLSWLIRDLRQTSPPSPALYVLVQTSNGIDPATGAQQDGNFPNGELRGAVVPE